MWLYSDRFLNSQYKNTPACMSIQGLWIHHTNSVEFSELVHHMYIREIKCKSSHSVRHGHFQHSCFWCFEWELFRTAKYSCRVKMYKKNQSTYFEMILIMMEKTLHPCGSLERSFLFFGRNVTYSHHYIVFKQFAQWSLEYMSASSNQ